MISPKNARFLWICHIKVIAWALYIPQINLQGGEVGQVGDSVDRQG